MWSTSYQTPRTSTHRYLFLWADKLKITPFSGYITEQYPETGLKILDPILPPWKVKSRFFWLTVTLWRRNASIPNWNSTLEWVNQCRGITILRAGSCKYCGHGLFSCFQSHSTQVQVQDKGMKKYNMLLKAGYEDRQIVAKGHKWIWTL